MLKIKKTIISACQKSPYQHWPESGLLRICRNTSALLFIRIFNYLVPFLVLPYLSRILGVTGFGRYAMAISICAVLLMVTDYGFYLSGTHKIAKNQHDKHQLADYLSAVIVVKLLLILLCSLVLIIISRLLPAMGLFDDILLPVILLVISQSFHAEWLFQGIEKLTLAIYPFLTGRLCFLLMVFVFIDNEQQSQLVIYLLALSNCLTLLVSGYLLYREGFYLVLPDIKHVKQLIKRNIMFFLSSLAAGLYSSSGAFIIGFSNGNQAAGIYSAAEKLYLAGQSLTAPLSQVLYPYLAGTGDKKLFYRLLLFFLLPLILLCLTLMVFSAEIITFIYGADFIHAAVILNVFLICAIVNFISANFGYPAFAVLNRLDVANIIVVVGGLLQIISISLLWSMDKLNGLTLANSILIIELVVMSLKIGIFFYLLMKNNG